MPIWRLQVTWQLDSTAPRDKVSINPHFWDSGATTDPQNLCDSMADGLVTIAAATGEVKVTAYDAQGTKPVYPAATAVRNTGVAEATTKPRELAVCLSYYAERNVPRQRGRLYMPAHFLGIATSNLRPVTAIPRMQDFVTLCTGLGGVDVDWAVYSKRAARAFSITDYWWDDEWDVVRSRGLRGSSRVEGTTNEGLKNGGEARSLLPA